MGAFPAFYDFSNPVFWPPLTLPFPLYFLPSLLQSLSGAQKVGESSLPF